MAYTKSKSSNDNADKKGKRPDFVLRARQSPDSDFFITIGAAWKVSVNGEDGYSVKLTAIPVGGWDGSILMLVPKEE